MNITWNSLIISFVSLWLPLSVFERLWREEGDVVSVNKRLKTLAGFTEAVRGNTTFTLIPVLVYYFFLLILGSKKEKNPLTPHGRVWPLFWGGREGTEKWASSLRDSSHLIGRRGALKKHQYLNQVEKKVRGKTDSRLSVVPSAPSERLSVFFVVLIWGTRGRK